MPVFNYRGYKTNYRIQQEAFCVFQNLLQFEVHYKFQHTFALFRSCFSDSFWTVKGMSVNKNRSCVKKDCHFSGLDKFLKIDVTGCTYLFNNASTSLETWDPLSLYTLIECSFDSNL